MLGPKVTINIIGGGKVGKTLGYLFLHRVNEVTINQVYCRTQQSAEDATNFIGGGQPISDIDQLTKATITFITTRDDSIQATANIIANTTDRSSEREYYIHCSGALTAMDGLSSLKDKGAFVASCHPAISFSSPSNIIKNYIDGYCGMEGDETAVRLMRKYFAKIGFKPFTLNEGNKDLYHAACVSSNNFIYALAHLSSRMFKESGVSDYHSAELTNSIMRNALLNLDDLEFKDVLSGPIARADIDTITKHKKSVQALDDKNIEDVFRDLGRYCLLNLTNHSQRVRRAICDSIGD